SLIKQLDLAAAHSDVVILTQQVPAGVSTAEARIFAPTEQELLHQAAARPGETFDTTAQRFPTAYTQAREYINSRDETIVVKASGLAKGKGVFVCETVEDALLALDRIMLEREFGDAGDTVIVEECLIGREVSVLALIDGRNLFFLEPAQDHKRLLDGGQGPNTGGMGAFCPSGTVDDDTMRMIQKDVFVPVIDAMLRDGVRYRGVLYAGLMLTAGGPRVLEFNCRFGDPEAQVLLMRLRSDLIDIMEAVIDGKLDEQSLDWDPRVAVCVVMAAEGYPGSYENGRAISGLPDTAGRDDLTVFHAGTQRRGDEIVTSGGRVLGVTALGDSLADARDKAYQAADRISFDGAQYRRDIGASA
ncbi:MAG: phosphoribosylamine--glycine ligase, partial [Planctomycetes bacterium]|nr:phosphoribosylamine--glycine ligase [Planctomycetota bacterium]